MTPADYVVPAERVVEVLKGSLWGYAGEEPRRHAPMSRSQLLDALKIKKPRDQRRFAQQLQHMFHKCWSKYRVSFQHYPTGWIYDPPAVGLVSGERVFGDVAVDATTVSVDPPPDQLAHGSFTMTPQIAVATVSVDDLKIVCEWAAGQWVSGPAHDAFKRLREAAK